MRFSKLTLLYICGAVVAALAACKTTEANYRAAYEKAIAGRDSLTALENTIYGKYRKNTSTTTTTVEGDTVEMISTFVTVTEGGGGIRENLKPYSVVVGQFKQLVNARSLRTRLVDAGFPSTFVVQTAEPYYYVLIASYPTRAEAVKRCAEIRADKDFPITLREEMPLVLYCPR